MTDEEIIELWMREPEHRIGNIVPFARALLALQAKQDEGRAVGCVYAVKASGRTVAVEWFRSPGPAGTLLYTTSRAAAELARAADAGGKEGSDV
mgnify:CR=1 FL=1